MQWFWVRADTQQWEEELTMLCAEFKRTHRTFTFLQMVWAWAGECFVGSKPGYIAYSQQQSEMFLKLADDCRKRYEEVEGCKINI